MNRNIFTVAFLLGALAVVWVGAGYVGSNTLALAVTVISPGGSGVVRV